MGAKQFFSRQRKGMLYLLCVGVFATIAVLFSLLVSAFITSDNSVAISHNLINCLAFAFYSLGAVQVFYAIWSKKKRHLIKHLVFCGALCLLGLLCYVAENHTGLFRFIVPAFFCVAASNRILLLTERRGKRTALLNVLCLLLIALVVLIAIGLGVEPDGLLTEIALLGIGMFVVGLGAVISAVTVGFQTATFLKIIRRTYATEFLIGLLILIAASSVVFLLVEPKCETFGDALWYCFAIVTTIGFGDKYAVTWIGRIISVVLGIYGLIIVAVITSIIVNFYNEMTEERRALETANKNEGPKEKDEPKPQDDNHQQGE